MGKRERLRREASDWVARLEGHSDAEDREAFRRWYDADPVHAETFDRVKAVYGSAGLLTRTELGRSRALPASGKAARPSGYALAAGLAALLVVSGAVLLGGVDSLMPRAEAETLLFATEVGEIRQVPLPDGSRMTLDAKSSVKVRMGEDLRQVTVSEGRARFALAPKDERPFVVEAGETQVTGRAGTFDVALIAGDATVQPIVGTVSVETSRAAAGAEPVRLRPGQVILVEAEGDGVQTRSASRSAALWPTGRLEFVNTPLDRVIAEANRYSRGGISLADPALARFRVTGTFQAGDLDGLSRSLASAFMLRLERSDDGQFVLHATASERQKGRR